MRIAINGLAVTAERTGIGRVTLQTLRALLPLAPNDEFVLLLPRDAPQDLGFTAPNLEVISVDVSLRQPLKSLFFGEFSLPRRLKGLDLDLYYAPSYLLPAWPGARVEVICVHDLAWRLHPRSKSLLFRTYMNRRLPGALKRARRIVCVSEATAADLRREYPATAAHDLRVVPNGVDLETFSPDPAMAADGPPFIAVVGNQDPRKNIGTLLDAFPIFRARMRPCRLVMVGPGAPPQARPAAVDFLGYLGEAELASLYRRALMVVQPSLYEGFGLPVLEAMACGTAVACADIPVFHEVAGECANYFDPKDTQSIVDAMEELARDDTRRAELAAAGRIRAEQFSWERSARGLLEVFREAVS